MSQYVYATPTQASDDVLEEGGAFAFSHPA